VNVLCYASDEELTPKLFAKKYRAFLVGTHGNIRAITIVVLPEDDNLPVLGQLTHQTILLQALKMLLSRFQSDFIDFWIVHVAERKETQYWVVKVMPIVQVYIFLP
jgi:hypothetical protein